MKLLSVIIPVYNQEQYISSCIDCIQNQSFKDWELIVVDDGSTDATPRLVDGLSELDDRISVFHIQNGGAGFARNIGLEHASGKYVAFIDADDRVMPDYFDNIVSTVDSAKADVAYFSHLIFNEAKIVHTVHHPLGNRVLEEDEVDKYVASLYGADLFETGVPFPIAPWAAIFKYDVIKRFQVRFPRQKQLEDCIFNINFCRHALKIVTSDYAGYCYRREGQESLSGWGEADVGQVIGCLESLRILAEEEPANRRVSCAAGASRTILRWTRLLMGRIINSGMTGKEKRCLFFQVARNRLIRESNEAVLSSRLPLWERIYRHEVLRESYVGVVIISLARQMALRIVRHDY